MKELPKMYHNNIDKNINNNKKIFSTMYNSDTEVKSTNNFIMKELPRNIKRDDILQGIRKIEEEGILLPSSIF